MAEETTTYEIGNAEIMFNPSSIQLFGSIHAAVILCVLAIRHHECLKAEGLGSEGCFTCPRRMLEDRIGLGIATINKHLKGLTQKGALTIQQGSPGQPRRFKINDKVLSALSFHPKTPESENRKEGGDTSGVKSWS